MIDINNIIEGEILPMYKPLHWTSFDVVNKVKSIFKSQNIKLKIGHAGTLDPLAEGLLVVCTGKYTKQIESIQSMPKTYEAEFFLGATRPSFDRETEINQNFSIAHIQNAVIENAIEKLSGEIWQTPPIYSAIKRNGKPLYESARQGIDVVIEPRKQIIYSFIINAIELPIVKTTIECSKGTYIRSLANDFGLLCESGAYLHNLKRTKIGKYNTEEAYSIEDIEKLFLSN
jgi:tRNA pseudouridine55 synthase